MSILLTKESFAQGGSVQPEEALQLLEEIEAPANDRSHLWSWVSSMALNQDGTILAVLNIRPPRVSLLDSYSLNLISSFGRKGKGPGELGETLGWIGIGGDTVYVSQGFRTLLFSLDGKHLDRDIITPNRTIDAQMLIHQANGVDRFGSVYYWDARRTSKHLIGKKFPDGSETHLIMRDDLGVDNELKGEDVKPVFNVLDDGSVIIALSHHPVVARYGPNGAMQWKINVVKQIPMISKNYEKVQRGQYVLPMNSFWADELYTILKYSNEEQKQGKPNVYYVFLNSNNGDVVKVAYAAQNVIREPVLKEDETYTHQLYNPRTIAHKNGVLFGFSFQSAHIQKYRLTWHK